MNAPLPVGTYILNNGPRKKGQGGRFTMGTHRVLKQLMKDVPGVTFTDRPDKADFVILPEGVKEPGRKLTQRNPSLKDPRRVFSMEQITHVMQSEAYHHYKYGLMYTAKDAQGRPVQIDVPVNLEPSDQAFMQSIAKVSNVNLMVIPDTDYTVVRRNLRGAPQLVVVPGPPPGPQQQQQPSPAASVAVAAPSAAPTNNLLAKIAQVDALLGTLGSVPPLEPTPALPVAAHQQMAQLQAQQIQEQQQLAQLQARQLQEQQQLARLQAQQKSAQQRPAQPPVAAADIERIKAEGRQSLAALNATAGPARPRPTAPPSSSLEAPAPASLLVSPLDDAVPTSDLGWGPAEPAPTSLLSATQQPAVLPSSQLQVDIQAVLEIYTRLSHNKTYNSADIESMFASSEPRTSRDVLGLIRQIEKFRMALQAVLYTLSPANIKEQHQIAETLAQQKIRAINSALVFLRESIAKSLLPTLDGFRVNDPSAAQLQKETVSRMLVETLAYLKQFITLLSQRNVKYRDVIFQNIRDSQGGLNCRKSGLFCQDFNEPEDIRAVIWSLFNSACQIVQTSSDQFATKIEFQASCKQNELVHATLCDIYNQLFVQGFYGGKPPTNVTRLACTSQASLCQDFYTAIDHTFRAYEELAQAQTGVNILEILHNLQVASTSDRRQMWKVGSKPTIYNYFYRFLLNVDPETNRPTPTTRPQSLSEIQTLMVKFSAVDSRRIYLEMIMAALFFQLANFCAGHKGLFGSGFRAAGTGDFTIPHIQGLLKEEYSPPADAAEEDSAASKND